MAYQIIRARRCRNAATLHHRDAGMITISDEPYGKIHSDLQLATFVRRGMQCPCDVAKILGTAKLYRWDQVKTLLRLLATDCVIWIS
jgi:hypothetical protein